MGIYRISELSHATHRWFRMHYVLYWNRRIKEHTSWHVDACLLTKCEVGLLKFWILGTPGSQSCQTSVVYICTVILDHHLAVCAWYPLTCSWVHVHAEFVNIKEGLIAQFANEIQCWNQEVTPSGWYLHLLGEMLYGRGAGIELYSTEHRIDTVSKD